ncbi:hypothetical protein [Nostoc sp.]
MPASLDEWLSHWSTMFHDIADFYSELLRSVVEDDTKAGSLTP